MKVHSHSEPGGHLKNEDAVGVVQYANHPSTIVCALADGQGGQAGGALAARLAVESCLEMAQDLPLDKLFNPVTWLSIGEAVDRNVSHNSQAGYATFIGLILKPSFVIGVSCGDSAVTLLRNGKLVELTKDQHKNPPIGSGTARLTPFLAKLDGDWKLLVISDGVWKFAGWEAIAETSQLASENALISGLREVAVSNTGGRMLDDFSVILIEP